MEREATASAICGRLGQRHPSTQRSAETINRPPPARPRRILKLINLNCLNYNATLLVVQTSRDLQPTRPLTRFEPFDGEIQYLGRLSSRRVEICSARFSIVPSIDYNKIEHFVTIWRRDVCIKCFPVTQLSPCIHFQ